MEDLRCAYEIAREEQIKNKEFLKSLNLINPITKELSTSSTKKKKTKR